MRPALLTLLAATGLLAAGCGAVGHLGPNAGSAARGAALFKTTCGGCHTLAAAGTTGGPGIAGPNLDASFGPDRCQGIGDPGTIRDIVRGQIAYPETGGTAGSGIEPAEANTGMPQNLVRGQDAKDISAYVASVAGVMKTPGTKQPYWDCATGAEVTP